MRTFYPQRQHRLMASVVGIAITLGTSACSLSRLVDAGAENSNQGADINAEAVTNPAGALGLYRSAVGVAQGIFAIYTVNSGFMTDELHAVSGLVNAVADLDARTDSALIPQGKDLYSYLSSVRVHAQHARGAIATYIPNASPKYAAELFGLQAAAEILLAESMCSGIPMATAPYNDNIRFSRGFTTAEVFQHAVDLLDSALIHPIDSLPIRTLVQVLKGRALLGLGQYAAAAAAVSNVPTDALYTLHYAQQVPWQPSVMMSELGITNAEGINGLRWLSPDAATQDPRVPVTTTNGDGVTYTNPVLQAKYVYGTTTEHLADGIEARLVEAEADLKGGGTQWLATLNMLRATVALPDTTDPGLDPLPPGVTVTQARTDLLFRERAFWLYLTGHRQGDLRRLIRQYGRSVNTVYPSGPYPFLTAERRVYGNIVTLPVPDDEIKGNSLYQGCINRDA